MKTGIRSLPFILLIVSVAGSMSGASPALAVIVNKASAVTEISSADLRRIYLGEMTRWSDGKSVSPALLSVGSPEAQALLTNMLKMSEVDYRRVLMHSAFVGKVFTQPKRFASDAEVIDFVNGTPGAIGCIRADSPHMGLRVLKVDGAAPGDGTYKLTLP